MGVNKRYCIYANEEIHLMWDEYMVRCSCPENGILLKDVFPETENIFFKANIRLQENPNYPDTSMFRYRYGKVETGEEEVVFKEAGFVETDYMVFMELLNHHLLPLRKFGLRRGSVSDVVKRIEQTPLAPVDREEMLRHPNDLSISESGRVYRRVNFGDVLDLPEGRRCKVDWTGHGEYRSELRGIDPAALNEQLCSMVEEIRQKKPVDRNVRLPGAAGLGVVDYDARRDDLIKVITTWK